MKVLVCGGRDYAIGSRVFAVLDAIHDGTPITLVIHGAAQGADMLAESWARERGVSYVGEPARWKQHGKAAGPIRNRYMLDQHSPDLVVAFPGGNGTADMVLAAKAAGVKVFDAESREVP